MYSYFIFNPEGPKSNQHEISPYNINALENRAGLRIEYMIRREDESNWYFKKILPTTSIEKVKGRWMRILILILGFKELITLKQDA